MPADETPMSGWGAHLGAVLNTLVTVRLLSAGLPARVIPVLNVAKGGASTASHREEHLWEALLAESLPGDIVLIQFGHNDSKRDDLAAHDGFRTHLTSMVDDAHAKGLHPVLVTPAARRRFVHGEPVDTHGDYPMVTRQLADDLHCDLIDLNRTTGELHRSLGETASRGLYVQYAPGDHPLYPDGIVDDTHYRFAGAVEVARLVARVLVDIVVPLLRASHAS